MRLARRFLGVLSCILLICGFAESAQGNSVYAITYHENSIVQVYDIPGEQIDPQFTGRIPDNGSGAVGLALADSGTLFASYDGSAKIVWADAKTMQQKGFIDLEVDYGASQLAGIVTDEGKRLDLGISSCYNKVLLLLDKMLGIRETFERERSES